MSTHKIEVGVGVKETVKSNDGNTVLTNENGKVTLWGDNHGIPTIGVEIPPGRSALSVLFGGNGDLADGDAFNDKDWWRYRNGQRYKKWFVPVENSYKRVWPPNLERLPRLLNTERRLWAVMSRTWDRLGRAIRAAIPEGQKHVEYEAPRKNGDGTLCYEFELRENWGDGWTYWVGGTRDKKLTPAPEELVQAIWSYERHAARWGSWLQLVEYAFKQRVRREFPKDIRSTTDLLPVRLRVGGLDFWFRASVNSMGHIVVSKLAWPRDKVLVIDGGGND